MVYARSLMVFFSIACCCSCQSQPDNSVTGTIAKHRSVFEKLGHLDVSQDEDMKAILEKQGLIGKPICEIDWDKFFKGLDNSDGAVRISRGFTTSEHPSWESIREELGNPDEAYEFSGVKYYQVGDAEFGVFRENVHFLNLWFNVR